MNLNDTVGREAWAWSALFVILTTALATMCPASVPVGLPYVVVVMLVYGPQAAVSRTSRPG